MKHPVLAAEDRKILGKKVKHLRREGLLPANVYGKKISSRAIQVRLSDFEKIFKEVGETGLIELKVEDRTHPVLVKNLQSDHRLRKPLHVDFYEVNLKEKVKAMVPVVLIGEPKAVSDKLGMLLQTLSEVEVEALPDKLPEKIEVPVEYLAELDESIVVSQVKAPEGVAILNDEAQVVAKITELMKEEEPEPQPEAAEGEAPAEGATEGEAAPAEETKETPAE